MEFWAPEVGSQLCEWWNDSKPVVIAMYDTAVMLQSHYNHTRIP